MLLAGLLASAVILFTVVIFCLCGQFRRASRVAFRWAIRAAAYAAILAAAAMIPHESALKIGALYCGDDLYRSIESISKMPERAGSSYRFGIRLFGRANHGPRSAKSSSVYLKDERNRRFPPYMTLPRYLSMSTWNRGNP